MDIMTIVTMAMKIMTIVLTMTIVWTITIEVMTIVLTMAIGSMSMILSKMAAMVSMMIMVASTRHTKETGCSGTCPNGFCYLVNLSLTKCVDLVNIMLPDSGIRLYVNAGT